MWGKLTEFVQDKLETSVSDDDKAKEGIVRRTVRFLCFSGHLMILAIRFRSVH